MHRVLLLTGCGPTHTLPQFKWLVGLANVLGYAFLVISEGSPSTPGIPANLTVRSGFS